MCDFQTFQKFQGFKIFQWGFVSLKNNNNNKTDMQVVH